MGNLAADPNKLAAFHALYAKADGAAAASRTTAAMPRPDVAECKQAAERARTLLPARLLPRWDRGDPAPYPSRSEADSAVYVALLAGGMTVEEVFAAVLGNENLMQRCLDARKRDYPKATRFAWQEVNAAGGYEAEHPRRPPEANDFAGDDGEHTYQPREEVINQQSGGLPAENAGTVARKAKRGKLVHVGQLDQQPRVDWLIHGMVESHSLVMLFGEPGTGKSFVALDWAQSIARGVDWNGHKVKRGAVFYVAGEGHQGLSRRLLASARHHGYELGEVPLFVSRMGVPFSQGDAVAELIEEIRTLLLLYELDCACIIIDTLRRNFGIGDENSTKDMAAFIAGCVTLQHALDTTVAVVHHTGHGDKERERGSSTLAGDFDIRYQVAKASGGYLLRNVKMKDAEPPDVMHFDLTQVPLGYTDDEGEQITSAVPVWVAPELSLSRFEKAPRGAPRRADFTGQDQLSNGAAVLLTLLYQLTLLEGHTPSVAMSERGAVQVVAQKRLHEEVVRHNVTGTDQKESVMRAYRRWFTELRDRQQLIDVDETREWMWLTETGRRRLEGLEDLDALLAKRRMP